MIFSSRKISPPFSSFFPNSLLLSALVLISYLPALKNDFVWDDRSLLLQNQAVIGSCALDQWRSIWNGSATPDFFPLTYSFLKLEWLLWGAWSPGFHALNILLHLASTLMLWQLLNELGVLGAWWAAAFFALHPVNVETVAWVSEIKNTLSLALALGASLFFFDCGKSKGSSKSFGQDLISLVFFVASLLAKTSVVMLPCVWLVTLWWKRQWSGWKTLLRLAPFLVASLIAGIITLWFQTHKVIHQEFSSISPGLLAEIIRALWALGFYLRQLALPDSLSMLYDNRQPEQGISGAWVFLVSACLLSLAAISVNNARWARAWLTAFSGFLLLLLPVLGFLPMYYLRLAPVADQWLYLPAIPIFAFAGAGLEGKFLSVRKGIFALLLILCGVLTWQRCHELRSTTSLWNGVLEQNHNSKVALQNLALALQSQGDWKGAISLCNQAVSVAPNDLEPRLNLAFLLGSNGKTKEALTVVDKAIARWPESPDMVTMKADLLARNENNEEALVCYQKAVILNPNQQNALIGVGKMEFALGHPDLAIEPIVKFLSKNPNSVEALNILGASQATLGHKAEAESAFRNGLQIEPSNSQIRYNLELLQQ